jgi:hypothetical protein
MAVQAGVGMLGRDDRTAADSTWVTALLRMVVVTVYGLLVGWRGRRRGLAVVSPAQPVPTVANSVDEYRSVNDRSLKPVN